MSTSRHGPCVTYALACSEYNLDFHEASALWADITKVTYADSSARAYARKHDKRAFPFCFSFLDQMICPIGMPKTHGSESEGVMAINSVEWPKVHIREIEGTRGEETSTAHLVVHRKEFEHACRLAKSKRVQECIREKTIRSLENGDTAKLLEQKRKRDWTNIMRDAERADRQMAKARAAERQHEAEDSDFEPNVHDVDARESSNEENSSDEDEDADKHGAPEVVITDSEVTTEEAVEPRHKLRRTDGMHRVIDLCDDDLEISVFDESH